MKVLEENTRNYYDMGVDKDFWDSTQKIRIFKILINQTSSKLRTFKDTIKKMKRETAEQVKHYVYLTKDLYPEYMFLKLL